MKTPANGAGAVTATSTGNPGEGEKKSINSELWQACAGPLANLPVAGTHVVYFPQGHSEQVAASMKKDVDAQIPNYPNLPSKLICLLHNVTLHADPETDEVYAQMTLQPVPSFDKEALLRSDLSTRANKPQPEFFCKTLTASDTSTHGGFSVPRRAAEKIFPPLDFTMQPPAQELMARDLHDNSWTFRHIYRGQPKRHLLTTGWSLFISGKRLFAGDSVLFIRDEKQQLLLGTRRANRQPTNLSSSVLSSDSMHIGILAAAAHAAANNSPFTVFYNPRASPSEFVIPLAKYYKAACSNQISLGMRFRMMFETEESGTRRYMGTITGISDLDPVRWKNSQWRNLQVGWDESTAGERRSRVSIWEIEPVTAPFFICPTPPLFRPKRPRQPGMPDEDCTEFENLFKRTMPWIGDDMYNMKDSPGLSLFQWMNMQQNNPSLSNNNTLQPNFFQNSLPGATAHVLQNFPAADLARQLGLSSPPQMSHQQNNNNLQFNPQRQQQQPQLLDQLSKLPTAATTLNPPSSVITTQSQQQLAEFTQQQQPKQNLINQNLPSTQTLVQNLQQQQQQQQHAQTLVQNLQQQQQQQHTQTLVQNLQQQQQQQQQIMGQNQQQHLMTSSQLLLPDQMVNQQLQMSDNQVQLQLLQKLQQQRQAALLAQQQSTLQQQQQDQQRQQLLDGSLQRFSRSTTTPGQMMLEMPPQSQNIPQQHVTNVTNLPSVRFSLPPKLPPSQQQLGELPAHMGHTPAPTSNQLSTGGSSSILTGAAAGGGQSGITDDIPSCSTSPSTNNCPNLVQPIMNSTAQRREDMTMSANGNGVKDVLQKPDIKPPFTISKSQNQNQGFFSSHTYLNATGTQADYLDSSSSATSVCISSQNDAHLLQHNNNPVSFNPQSSVLFRDANQDGETHGGDPRNSFQFAAINIDNQLGEMIPLMPDSLISKSMVVGSGKDFLNNLSSGEGGMLPNNYDYPKDSPPELSSSMVSPQSFGVPDIAFNSIDSAINDTSFLNTGGWAPATQFQRMRTYTKVYKRGAVGRSIDIARYSGYEELKQDLARRFGIEGQLEDGQRIGWKVVYVDHENDVLLVGDDPWEQFVNCVRCIKILSPQEVQQMSLDGDFGNNSVLQNQACSSSDGGNL